MKKNIITILAILILPIFAYMCLTNNNSKAQMSDITANKAQMLKFTSAMCLDCQKMNKIVKEICPKYSDKIVLTEIFVQDGKDDTKAQIEKYNVTLVPTIILINSKGKEVKRIEGAISKNTLERYLKGLN